MIRFLQKENRLTKALFVVIIAAASVSMVVYLIPGLTGQSATSADTFAWSIRIGTAASSPVATSSPSRR